MITALLIYLSIGSLIWVFMDMSGIIDTSVARRNAHLGASLVLATLAMILLWPWFVASWALGMWRTRV